MGSNHTIHIAEDYKVIIWCLTYNQSRYIVDALNGFAIQQTNFPFACVVMDDNSTDGEQVVITNWLQKECDMARAIWYDMDLATVIIVPHHVNVNFTVAVYLLKRNLFKEENIKYNLIMDFFEHCEYLALCEGDDYWTDPEKLQIQADCLDAHPEVDMCAHSSYVILANSNELIKINKFGNSNLIIPLEVIVALDKGFINLCSIFYRVNLERNLPAFRQYFNYDYSVFIHGALRGGIYYINRVMSVYRKNVENSLSSKWFADKQLLKVTTDKAEKMLELLAEDQYFKSDNVRKKVIFAGCLRLFINFHNTSRKNIHYLYKYRDGLYRLRYFEKIKVLILCVAPKIWEQGSKLKQLLSSYWTIPLKRS